MALDGMPEQQIQVYTTRPDTIFGMTFVALAPHHPLVDQIVTPAQRALVTAYQETVNSLRTSDEQTATGVFTGAYVLHPFSGERIPIWIADFVLEEYGAGAVMGVPAHDERDMAFAQHMGLPIQFVVQPAESTLSASEQSQAFIRSGMLTASGAYSGMTSEQARVAISDEIETRGLGKRSIKYRLRDWLISRQRYWGPPIPIIYCPEHGAVPVPEDQLPVLLPDVEHWMPTGTGVAPLAAIESFVQTTCPICAQPARRETDVSDNFLDSAWYYLRYPSVHDASQAWDPDMTRKWLPVDMCIGGADHSVLHLMYVRFIAKALHDLDLLEFNEPFTHFRANGTITRDGTKISKSKGNVINPDEYIQRLGADAFRLHLMFMGPYEADGDYSDRGIGGVIRFLDRIWVLVQQGQFARKATQLKREELRLLHLTIKRVSDGMQAFKYNTSIAALMEFLNTLERRTNITRQEIKTLLSLLAPFAPYITEELWEHIGQSGSVHRASWPNYDPQALPQDTMLLPIQVDGRLRARLEIASDASEEEIKQQAIALEKIQPFIAGHTPQRIIYVPGRLVNIVL